jgi:23S rRNA pseudouridine1911/1915/1917 synthase
MEQENGAGAHSDIEVLYEDDDVIVINKPAGIMVHEDGRSEGPTVVDWFLARAPGARGVGEPGYAQDGTLLDRSGVVHRLDRETSGVLILAKTQPAFIHLKGQFHGRRVRKEYRAFVYGTMKEQWGTIDRPIGRSGRNPKLRSAERGAQGVLRPAVTDWERIGQSGTFAYLKLIPKTGRTHQLRVHLKAIGRPILGDTLYAPGELLANESLGLTRLALHAYSLTLTLEDGIERTFIAPLPEDFENARRALAST